MNREPHELREIGETLAFLRQPEPPGGWREALDMLPLMKTVMAMKPRDSGTAYCQEIVLTGDDIDLAKLPVQTCWPGEPAPLITWPLVVTKGPGGDKRDAYNLGIYRMQVTGRDTTYTHERNLIRALVMHGLRAHRVPFRAADSANRRGRFPRRARRRPTGDARVHGGGRGREASPARADRAHTFRRSGA